MPIFFLLAVGLLACLCGCQKDTTSPTDAAPVAEAPAETSAVDEPGTRREVAFSSRTKRKEKDAPPVWRWYVASDGRIPARSRTSVSFPGQLQRHTCEYLVASDDGQDRLACSTVELGDEREATKAETWKKTFLAGRYNRAVLVTDARSKRLLVVRYHAYASGSEVLAFDLESGKQLWEHGVQGLGPIAHSEYHTQIQANIGRSTDEDDVLHIYGNESSGRFVETVRLADGGMLSNHTLHSLDHYPELPRVGPALQAPGSDGELQIMASHHGEDVHYTLRTDEGGETKLRKFIANKGQRWDVTADDIRTGVTRCFFEHKNSVFVVLGNGAYASTHVFDANNGVLVRRGELAESRPPTHDLGWFCDGSGEYAVLQVGVLAVDLDVLKPGDEVKMNGRYERFIREYDANGHFVAEQRVMSEDVRARSFDDLPQ